MLITSSVLRGFAAAVVSGLAAGATYLGYGKYCSPSSKSQVKRPLVNIHEKRFRDFASAVHNGVLFMTPADFLSSIVKDHPPKPKFVILSDDDVESILQKTPSKAKGSPFLFREIQEQGLLSFPEYLFLLHILTKPKSGFEIAFRMLDTDMSGSVDAVEFIKLNQVIAEIPTSEADEVSQQMLSISTSPKDRFNTTLVTHLFGRKSKCSLTLADFIRFIRNVQKEALDVEFQVHSMGASFIYPVDFARILLRHASLSSKKSEAFIDRLQSRDQGSQMIQFGDFLKFFDFLNSLDDFALAMKMYTLADRPISMPDFNRAVKACTGSELSESILVTIFALFDADGDGCLSHDEFMKIMRNRQSRSMAVVDDGHPVSDTYRQCVARKTRSQLI